VVNASSGARGTTIFGKVIDGTLDPPIERGAVVFEGERLKWVGRREALPALYQSPDYECIDLPGRSILPGLIDGHTHISNDSLITPDSLDGAAFRYEEFKAIADETHRLGKICTVHARSRDSIRDAARAGFDLLFHASFIDDEGIEHCLKNDITITPTLTLLVNIIEASNGTAGVSGVSAFQREVAAATENLPRAYRAGVPLVAGSESGWSPVPYGQWHAREMQIFVDLLGMSPLEAINAGTLAATRCLKRFGHEVGKLEANRLADILVVNGDPSQDITLLQKKSRFDFVFKGGKKVDLVPPPARKEWFFEHHKIFLNGRLEYDERTGKGHVVQ
jgi:imidazolonepropionase-like amidohydrolase